MCPASLMKYILFNAFTAPTLELSAVSSTTRLPDVTPYNTFHLTCTATAPEGVIAPKIFIWRRADPADVTCGDFSVVGGNVDSNLEQPVSTSVLNVTVSDADIGILRYCCQVSITDLSGMDVSDNSVTSITVVGESVCMCVFIYFGPFYQEFYTEVNCRAMLICKVILSIHQSRLQLMLSG